MINVLNTERMVYFLIVIFNVQNHNLSPEVVVVQSLVGLSMYLSRYFVKDIYPEKHRN